MLFLAYFKQWVINYKPDVLGKYQIKFFKKQLLQQDRYFDESSNYYKYLVFGLGTKLNMYLHENLH